MCKICLEIGFDSPEEVLEQQLQQAQTENVRLRRLLHDVRQTVNPLAAYPWLVDEIEAVFAEGGRDADPA